ncbi:hypothetical protein LTS18_012160 [Coniosporium uncinatum]|uniref:Uncharacterized protein n=1 Tax=Coniosporium uncinatum TaxID=93489 RepID=A0ACC3DZC2_9PEZI|nr:hypothetical protein LTS18_012160 [Coniosporium uncinatum]
MGSKEQMKAYEMVLREHTSSLDIPVTEIVIFKLLDDLKEETMTLIEKDFVTPAGKGDGVRRIAWGCSLDDLRTFVLMFDWRCIQDHWAFWQTPEFEPVMSCINKCFEPGRPLVRHYKFEPSGMVRMEYVQLLVWDEGKEKDGEELMGLVEREGESWKNSKAGFAVDMGEMTWCAVTLGYESEKAARADKVGKKGETHLLKLQYLDI